MCIGPEEESFDESFDFVFIKVKWFAILICKVYYDLRFKIVKNIPTKGPK